MAKSTQLKKLHKAEMKGRQAAKSGLSENDCPYFGRSNFVRPLRDAWLRGFGMIAKKMSERVKIVPTEAGFSWSVLADDGGVYAEGDAGDYAEALQKATDNFTEMEERDE